MEFSQIVLSIKYLFMFYCDCPVKIVIRLQSNYFLQCRKSYMPFIHSASLFSTLFVQYISTVVHDFNGHAFNGIHGVNGKLWYDGQFYVVNNGKIHV